MENINVKETIRTNRSFITTQEADYNAAYTRAIITKNMLVKYRTDINATNTADVNGRLLTLYEDLEFIAKEIMREEVIRAEKVMEL